MFFCGFFATKNIQTADGYSATYPAPTKNNIGEITLDGYETRTDGVVFDENKLNKLYEKLIYAATGAAPTTCDLKTAKAEVAKKSSTIIGSATKDGVDVSAQTQLNSLDFNTMQTTLGAPITLKFGGIDWTVVYATTNTTAGGNTKAGDLIVTLWANDNLTTSAWNMTSVADTACAYPTNMYSSSIIRVKTLNAGGDDGAFAGNTGTNGTTYYSVSTTTRDGTVTLDDRKSNQFAKFTLSNAVLDTNESLAQFLTAPKNVEYQKAENWVWSYMGTGGPYLFPNEAWGTPDTSLKHTATQNTGGWFGPIGNVASKTCYSEWIDDLLWLPSLTETGYYCDASNWGVSLWGISTNDNIIKPSGNSWMRSGNNANAAFSGGLTSGGAFAWPPASDTYGVRPALHLNLSVISRIKEVKTPPATVEKTYNGKTQPLSGETWYSSILDNPSLCNKTCTKDGRTASEMKDAGTYTLTYELRDTTKYCWSDGNANSKRTVTYTIKPKPLGVSFSLGDNGMPELSLSESPYTGDKVNCRIRYYEKSTGADKGTDLSKLIGQTEYEAKAEFDNPNYIPDIETTLTFINPATAIDVTWLDGGTKAYTGNKVAFNIDFGDYQDKIDLSYDDTLIEYDGYDVFRATNAGTYAITLSLKDKNNYVWGSAMGDKAGKTEDATIEFEITEKELELQVVTITPSDWSVVMGKTCDVYFDLPELVHSGTLDVSIFAQRTASSKPIEICVVTLTNDLQNAVKCQFDTTNITVAATYSLIVKAKDESDPNAKNYTFRLDKDYTLTAKDPATVSGIIWRLLADNAPAGSMQDDATSLSVTWDKTITYSGKKYSFIVNPSGLGCTVDETFGTKGYKTVKAGSKNLLGSVSNAGDYVTTVKLSNGTEYSIAWTIEKAKFDLSGVRWADDGKIPFNEKIAMKAELVKDSIPAGLTPVYSGVCTGTKVGDNGTAKVTFTVKDANNYVLPDENVAGSYLFTASEGHDDFEWSKDWVVIAREIPVDWSVGTIVLDSGKKINAEALSGGFDDYVEYEYYETDSKGNVLDTEAEPLTEPAITENKIRYYIAKAKIKPNYAGSYVFAPEATEDDLLSPVFEVGNALTAVKLAAKKTTYSYWGSPVLFQFQVTQGAISTDAFDVVYYRGTVRLLGAPTDPDSYRAQINLKSGYTGRYYIDGTYSFDFKIERGTIEIVWNENVKPPVLNLTENQAKYVSYEYRNADGNTVGISAMRTPGKYGVLARIKDTSKYLFDNMKAVTDWLEFTVNSGDTITDPTSSLPPFKPSTDPNDPSGGNPSGKTQVGIKTSNTTVYFNGNSQAAQFDNTEGLPESAFIVTYNGQTTPPTTAGAYQVVISLRPEFADRYELTGNTSFLYTILGANGEDGDNTGTLNGGATGGNASDATFVSYLPVILSGVSLVLIVVFCVMTLNYNSAAKAAKAKTKRLASITYSFTPLMAIVLGLSETNWWIIAGVLMGVALIMGIVAFLFKNKKQKALALLEEEEARLADEKAFAEKQEAREEQARRDSEMREEQARRDNEMRMMFAAMQQNSQQSLNYEAIQGMISSTVSALLPAMQQQMALPPAQEAAPSAAQEEIERLHAQMAQQQEMLNQILQNQQQAQESYAVYEEEPVDDISWLGDGEELVSLEESYGNLTDEGKRCYYEIGSYIMNKPRTSQNDGKYAVLFKYRGRTVFKLAIKDDAPVLYYPADDGGRGEIRIVGATLELAKSFIDCTVMSVDNELN